MSSKTPTQDERDSITLMMGLVILFIGIWIKVDIGTAIITIGLAFIAVVFYNQILSIRDTNTTGADLDQKTKGPN